MYYSIIKFQKKFPLIISKEFEAYAQSIGVTVSDTMAIKYQLHFNTEEVARKLTQNLTEFTGKHLSQPFSSTNSQIRFSIK